MASRRRKPNAPKPLPPDLGTPETRARLQPAPWAEWPANFRDAAVEIDLAVRLIAGQGMIQPHNLDRLARAANPEWTKAQAVAVRRYTWWRWQVARKGWIVGRLLDVICGGAPDSPALALREALALYPAIGRRSD